MRVRYGALLALTTSVEWSVNFLNQRAIAPVPEKKRGDKTNHTVKVLRELCARAGVSAHATIDDYEAIVNVRNCIVHSAGILKTYQFKRTLPAAIARLHGFSLANWNFFGDQVCIEPGALNQQIDHMEKLVVDVDREMSERGLMQPNSV